MNIHIASSTGKGSTTLSAFDAALINTGIANYNLVKLSSIIPENTDIVTHDHLISDIPGKWGDRLYVVMADKRVYTPNQEAWAGIGWVQDKKTKKGLFVEHEGTSKSSVEENIRDSLSDLMHFRNNENIEWGDIEMQISGGVCKHEPICALAVAVYQASDWTNKPKLFK